MLFLLLSYAKVSKKLKTAFFKINNLPLSLLLPTIHERKGWSICFKVISCGSTQLNELHLTYDLDLQSQASQGQGRPSCQKSRSKVKRESAHRQTDGHTHGRNQMYYRPCYVVDNELH